MALKGDYLCSVLEFYVSVGFIFSPIVTIVYEEPGSKIILIIDIFYRIYHSLTTVGESVGSEMDYTVSYPY